MTYLDYSSERTLWLGDAQFLNTSFKEIAFLAWVDQNFFIKDIVPIEGNEIRLHKNANTVQVGKSSITQWFSVLKGNAFQGFVLSSINFAKLIQPFEDTYLEGFMIQAKKNGEVIYNSSNWEEPNIKLMATQRLSLQKNADISVTCSPTKASIQAIQNIFYGEIAIALMLSLLASLTVFFAQKFYSLSKMNESRYRNLLDDANLLAIILNTKGEITYCNDFFLSATGWSRDAILGTDFCQRFFASDTRQEHQRFLESVTQGEIPNQTELSLITYSGETRWIHCNNTLQRDEKGNIIGFSALGEDITEQKKSAESLSKQYEFLKTLFHIDQAITARDHISKTLGYILDQINLQLGADASSVLLFNADTQSLEYAEGKGFKSLEIQRTCIPLGVGLVGKAALEKTANSICNLQDPKTGYSRKEMAMAEGFNWYHVEPLLVKDKVNGVLEVFFKENIKPDDNRYSLIKTIAQQIAIAIDNSTLFTDLEKSNQKLIMSYESTIEGWSRALDLRDKDTENHSFRVTEMTMRLCGLSGMSKDELINVRRGALLHDIGKMGIPDSILFKKEKLSDSDWEAIRKHPQFAYDLLYPIEYLRPALDIPYCHHEKWDGSGYPRGLKEKEIPLAARLFAVVDVWDALLSDRPYRKGWPRAKVVEEIKRLSGSHFDPEAVKLFISVIDEME
ncbi:MAG: PAS domain S-box protein [Sphaerochaeta sp.]|nr:PAS domain S-box protein [Sphaerochaeta sp.]